MSNRNNRKRAAKPAPTPAPTPLIQQIGVYRLNCSDPKRPRLFYGPSADPIDVSQAIADGGIEPTVEMLTRIAKISRRGPVVEVERAGRGKPLHKRLSPATIESMLRDIGMSMKMQVAAQ